MKTRIDRQAKAIPVPAAIAAIGVIGVRRDGQTGLLSIRNMGGEGKAAWRMCPGDLDARGLGAPDFRHHRRRARSPGPP